MTDVIVNAPALANDVAGDAIEAQDSVHTVAADRLTYNRAWIAPRMLVFADVAGLGAAFALIEAWLRFSSPVDTVTESLFFASTLPIWLLLAVLCGLYARDTSSPAHSTLDEGVDIFWFATLGAWLVLVGSTFASSLDARPARLLTLWLAVIVCVATARTTVRALGRRREVYVQKTIVVGAGPIAELIATKMLVLPDARLKLVGFVDDEATSNATEGKLPLLGSSESLPELIKTFGVERVVFTKDVGPSERIRELVHALRASHVTVDVVPQLPDVVGPGARLYTLGGLTLVGLPAYGSRRIAVTVKRCLDILLSAMALLALAPVLAVIVVLVKLDTPGPVFYRHDRVGRGGSSFRLFKFRTMRLEYCRGPEYGGEQAEDAFRRLMVDPKNEAEFTVAYKFAVDPRVTRVGTFLRSASLDELPQLINVLLGDISLVGPRPVTEDELPRYGNSVQTLLGVRPGVTGYWQINGRSRLTYDERIRLDLLYVSNWSIGLDLVIMAKTVWVLISRLGAY